MDETVNNLNRQAWMRYMARTIDLTIGSLLIGLSVGFLLALIFSPYDILSNIPGILLSILVIAIYLLIEAWIISTYKTTLGKKLLGITVTDKNGDKLKYSVSLKRDFYMWLAGLGLSLPLVSLVTLIISYNKYTEKGVTPWDEAFNVEVNYEPISNTRFIIAIILTLAVIVLNVYAYSV